MISSKMILNNTILEYLHCFFSFLLILLLSFVHLWKTYIEILQRFLQLSPSFNQYIQIAIILSEIIVVMFVNIFCFYLAAYGSVSLLLLLFVLYWSYAWYSISVDFVLNVLLEVPKTTYVASALATTASIGWVSHLGTFSLCVVPCLMMFFVLLKTLTVYLLTTNAIVIKIAIYVIVFALMIHMVRLFIDVDSLLILH